MQSIVLVILSAIFWSGTVQAKLLNRNILEVERQVYTQRDFEIYVIAKEGLFLRKGVAPTIVNAETWSSQLETYKNEMLINGLFNQEAQRLVSFLPNADMVRKSSEIIFQSIKRSSLLSDRYRVLKVTEPEVKSQIVVLLKVQAYLKSKANKVAQTDWLYRVDRDALWFKRIQKGMPFRFFEGANQHQRLSSL
ncbi:hypothetical protein [Pseudobacteriovorax antillogorgiicola]|uniref:Uncharacterized protein n=1 Tax=Pseudobacteriovorax antillogorgiicola TaxID=1513793 RepID=A0A1Y6CTV3_9BACT|nr:hypothetical protein [Pseudobacteriovorax antillogorgiicola]TCS44428.1 hypothetical protein EDD56_13355 [Pseudobacteriovorax antillogorgiicola]SMF78991.1 hypothetical protein SAMN06296036_13319 [Pseudobacteriovorax antillogorgiicola]